MQTQTFQQKRSFIIRLGKMLHRYGTPADRLEKHLISVSNALQLEGAFICLPTALTFILKAKGEQEQFHHIERVQPGDLDLGCLSRTDVVADNVAAEFCSIEEGNSLLDEIEACPQDYGVWINALMFFLTGGAFVILMRGSLYDALTASVISLLLFWLVLCSMRSKGVTRMLEPLVAFVSAFIAATVAATMQPAINVFLVVLSTIIMFIPGLRFTIGLAELSERNLLSGTANVMFAFMILFKLFFGAFLGMELAWALFGEVKPSVLPRLPEFTVWIAILVLSCCLIIAFKVRREHIVWSVVVALLSFFVSSFATSYFGYAIGAFIGAFVVGIYGNLFTYLANAPAVIVTMQGLIVLVPGSKTFISLTTFVTGKDLEMLNSPAAHALMIFISLVAGLLFANSALPAKRSL